MSRCWCVSHSLQGPNKVRQDPESEKHPANYLDKSAWPLGVLSLVRYSSSSEAAHLYPCSVHALLRNPLVTMMLDYTPLTVLQLRVGRIP